MPPILLVTLVLSAQTATPSFDPATALRGRWIADKLSMIEKGDPFSCRLERVTP